MPFLLGVISGALSSSPVGPVSLAVISNSVRGGFRSGFVTGLGAVLPNLLYAAAALAGLSFLGGAVLATPLKAAGALALFCVGLYDLMQGPRNGPVDNGGAHMGAAARGAILCLTNPFCLLFWAAVLGFLKHYGLPIHNGIGDGLPFLAGVAMGDALFFFLVARAGSAIRNRSDFSMLRKVNAGISLVLMGFALCWAVEILRAAVRA